MSQKIVHDLEKGEVVVRELTPEEQEQAIKDAEANEAEKRLAEEKLALKQSAREKLASLGLSDAEINAILGL